ncbi:hypothetical protein HYALB_00005658 [Hymenoscyphus albidus]|uniref:Rhodopsin domain-containing protein n=1 Tax=Hymenoscyphus albidus TaxID=595503 RepID=A0A9N9PUA3_9HELO|nr:hypothetical protein HYALB_00005658 [Hymenoscyphus albidus]
MYSSYATAAAITGAVFPTLATMAVVLRFRARHVKRQRYGTDDYIALAALAFAIALCCIVMYGAFVASIGQNLTTVTPKEYESYTKVQVFVLWGAHHIIYVVLCAYPAYGLAKICVLEFYKRIFITEQFHRTANITIDFIVLWTLAAEFTQMFTALPISQAWKFGGHYNLNYGNQALAFACFDILLDVITLCLPLPVISSLRLDKRHKVNIIAIFWTGIFCIFAASVRIYFTYGLGHFGNKQAISDEHFSYVSVNVLIWGEIESCCSIIASCLPSYGPLVQGTSLVRKLGRGFSTVVDLFSSRRAQASGASDASIKRNGASAVDVESALVNNEPRKWYQLQEGINVTTVSQNPKFQPKGTSAITVERTFTSTAEAR